MSGLLDLINSPMGRQLISGVSGQTGQPENKTADVLSMALPLLMGAMNKKRFQCQWSGRTDERTFLKT